MTGTSGTNTPDTKVEVLEWIKREEYPGGYNAETQLGVYSIASYDGMWTVFRNGYETIEIELSMDEAKRIAQADFDNRLAASRVAKLEKLIGERYCSQEQIDELASHGKLIPSNFEEPTYLAKGLTVIVLYSSGRWVTGRVDQHLWDLITHYHVPVTSPSLAASADAIRQLHMVVDAWEALPGDRQVKNKDVEAWLADSLSPAINAIRQFLHRPKPAV
ncbi:hypothetical protein OIU34_21585 [Pararhizobium sp. BT-229]|uniref:hypothetical protein n=1 Tax=Pararhizobium sp. BT-229 TaxID=2986923 RepID=UPI0021F7047D|nr:hypothetical protein [Pararhizobium sp. BT-229]MCV9964486.1 hypothetical protein [Pararhizobium sp. BT-229]